MVAARSAAARVSTWYEIRLSDSLCVCSVIRADLACRFRGSADGARVARVDRRGAARVGRATCGQVRQQEFVPFHLFRYLDEQAFRYNNRKHMNDSDRSDLGVRPIVGKRLTWAEVTGQNEGSDAC